MKNKKKSKELEIGDDVPSKLCYICSLLYQSHPLIFLTKVKRRCVYVDDNERERRSVANIFFRGFLPPSIYFFFKER